MEWLLAPTCPVTGGRPLPIYVVRWPEPMVSLITAENEEELIYLLDEAADPGGCTWQVYEGPLWVDFELPVNVDIGPREDKRRPLSPADVEVSIDQLAMDPLRLVPSEPQAGDTPFEMNDLMRQFAFPALHRALESADDPELIDTEALKAAVTEDLRPLLEYTWRQAQLEMREDPEAEIMRQLGVTVPFGGLNFASARNAHRGDDEPDDAEDT